MFRFSYLTILLFSQLVSANTLTLPLVFDETYNVPIISLNLTGTNIPFMLDTGSPEGLHITQELMDRIPLLTMQPKIKNSMDLAGRRFEKRSFMIERINIDGVIFNRIEGVEYQPWGLYYSNSPDEGMSEVNRQVAEYPVVGLGFFRDHILTLDFQNKLVTVEDADHIIPPDWLSLPFIMDEKEGVIVLVTDGLKEYRFVLDSGASATFIKAPSLPQRAKVNTHRDNYQFVELLMTNYKTQPIEAIVLDNLPEEFKADGLLGFNFLQQHAIKIDLKNKRMWFKVIQPQ